MKTFLSPADLARAIGASESSLKRWADEGRLAVSKTAGGHRRIPLAEAVRFIRRSGVALVNPEALGLGRLEGKRAARAAAIAPGDMADRLYDLLLRDDAPGARALIRSLYLAGWTVDGLGDGPLQNALGRVGVLWRHDEQGVFLEHRATQICLEALLEVRALLPPARPGAPAALSAAPANDGYLLPSVLAATVLADLGFADHNLGPHTPWPALGMAVAHHRPLLVAISLSVSPSDPRSVAAALTDLADLLASHGGALVVGGRSAAGLRLARRPNLHRGATMAELAAFARGILAVRTGGAAA